MLRRILRVLKYGGITILCLVIGAVASALLYRKHLQNKVAEARAIHSSQGINSLERVRIGGIDQWIEVRGQNVNNPILLFIHGGPGVAFMPLSVEFQGPWEKYFTVVEWDQRGAGKTYASNDKYLQRRTMNLPQMQQDALEVVNYLRGRFHREKVFVVGHSWGSVLGLWLAHEHPDLIYAFVGTGQLVNMRENAGVIYQTTLEQARKSHNLDAVRELESIAPYPANMDMRTMFIADKWAGELNRIPSGTPNFTDVRRILGDVLSSPEYSLADVRAFISGREVSAEALVPELVTLDLKKLGTDFRGPVFFFEGRWDPFCPPSLIWDYSQTIHAPQKGFVWFDRSGHFPFFEEQQKFTDELVREVLPLAKPPQAAN
jgi:pimeloyl-ACP methyl ester carboxylesterase